VARSERFELPTLRFEVRCATQLDELEIVMRDRGATDDEIAAILGPRGFVPNAMMDDRNVQLTKLCQWLERGGESLQ